MQRVPLDKRGSNNLKSLWRSREFFAQVFRNTDGTYRISINRCKIASCGTKWEDGITWDELQRIKNEVGFEKFAAVEIYPPVDQVVNVANMRHLWVLPIPPAYMWTKKNTGEISCQGC